MRLIKFIAIAISISILTGGCSSSESQKGSEDITSSAGEIVSADGEPVDPEFSLNPDEQFTDRDLNAFVDENESVLIQLDGKTAKVNDSSVSVQDGMITISKEGVYIVSGTLKDGMIIVDSGDLSKTQIVLNQADITAKSSAAVYVKSADKVFLTCMKGTENTLTNSGGFEPLDDTDIGGTVFSKQDLTLNGEGSLTIVSPSGHGIVAKDDLMITGGSYNVQSASHGVSANDSVRFTNSNMTIDAGKDGIHSENNEDDSLGYVYIKSGSLNIEAEGDGISAASDLQIDDGVFNVSAGGGIKNATQKNSADYDKFGGFFSQNTTESADDSVSMKGLKAGRSLLINNGEIVVDSADDAIHSNGTVVINRGSLTVKTGDDGVHAGGNLNICGGSLKIDESYEGLEGQNINISGGNIVSYSSDDGINAAGGNDSSGFGGIRGDKFGSSSNGSVLISSGNLYFNASGDGIDSNGSLEIVGGTIVVSGPDFGDTATLDFDTSGTISGGTFIGLGASGMNQNFSKTSSQGVIMKNIDGGKSGVEVILEDSNGTVLTKNTADQGFSCVILSCPEIKKGSTYVLRIGSESYEIEMTDTVYGSSSGMGGMDRPGGMNKPGGMGGRPW